MRTCESGLDPCVGYEHREVLDKNVGVSGYELWIRLAVMRAKKATGWAGSHMRLRIGKVNGTTQHACSQNMLNLPMLVKIGPEDLRLQGLFSPEGEIFDYVYKSNCSF